MRIIAPSILVMTALLPAGAGCKPNQPGEPAAAEGQAAPNGEGQNEEGEAAAAVAREPAGAAEAAELPPSEAAPDVPGRVIEALGLPQDWIRVSVGTPMGQTVSIGLPRDWLDVRPPNESTLLVRVPPPDEPSSGAKITVVATEFEGGRAQLVEHTKARLLMFASIKSEGSLRVGDIDGYELVASWSTPMGTRDTVQLLVATGREAIGVTCETPPGMLETLRGLCDEIFATLSVEGATPKK